MKKSFFVMLLFFFSFCSVNIVSAAPDPFSDVPANHWAYDAVNKLAKAGIVNGYGDGTFRGGRIVSRFEMAMIVGNAMTKYDNADAENKVLIKKLATEFAGELQTLGKRVTTLEQNQSRLKIDGIFQYRQEYVHNPSVIDEDANRSASPATAGAAREKSESRTMVWLNVANQFDGDTYFKGSLVSETLGGRTVDTQLQVWDAYMAKKIGPQAELAVGRFFIDVGLGTLGGGPYYDGVNLKFYGENVKANLYNVRFGFQGINPITSSQYDNYTFTIGDMKYSLNKDLTLVLAYFADKDKNLMNAKAVGMEYKITPEFALSGEYAKNDSSIAKIGDNNQNPKAYFIRMKHGGANPFVPGSMGLWVEYKKADPAFSPAATQDPVSWNAPFNWTSPAQGGAANNIKGVEFGMELTLAKRTIFTINYDRLRRVAAIAPVSYNSDLYGGKDNQSFFTAQIAYIF